MSRAPQNSGLSTTWDAADAEAVRAFNRRYADRLDFDERRDAMWQMYLDGYSATDIGVTFGITRQRARQILAKMGVRTSGALLRMWSDRLQQFVPCTPERYQEALRAARADRSDALYDERLQVLADALTECVEALGYIPGATEFARHVVTADVPDEARCQYLVAPLRFGEARQTPHAEQVQAIYDRAGIPKPSYGRLPVELIGTVGCAEAARILGYPSGNIGYHIQNNGLPCVEGEDHSRRFWPHEILAWKEAREGEAA